jgi:flagellar motor switch protein FliM
MKNKAQDAKKTYEIQGIKFQMGKLKIGHLKHVTKLIDSIEVDTNSDLVNIIEAIIENSLPDFMAIIFHGQPVDKVDWMEVDYDQVDEVVEDFFGSNPRLRRRLKSSILSLTSSLMSSMTPLLKNSPMTSSSTGSPEVISGQQPG